MALINEHYLKLTKNYLFADIAKKVNAFKVSRFICDTWRKNYQSNGLDIL